MFFTCKQVSNHLAKEDYDKLPRWRKMTLVFHVLVCPVCGAYNRQVMKFQDMARNFRQKQDDYLESDAPDSPHLRDTTRERMKEALKTGAGSDTEK